LEKDKSFKTPMFPRAHNKYKLNMHRNKKNAITAFFPDSSFPSYRTFRSHNKLILPLLLEYSTCWVFDEFTETKTRAKESYFFPSGLNPKGIASDSRNIE